MKRVLKWTGIVLGGLVGMPFELNQALTVDEMENLIAYIRSAPAVDSNHPEKEPGLLLGVIHVTNAFPLVTAELVDLDAAPSQTVDAADVLAYGEHLAVWCTACHGVDFAGMDMMGMTTPNITAGESGIGSWTEEDFSRAVREGLRPDGSVLDAEGMPWQEFSHFSDEEVHAIWTYLQSVEPVETE